MKVISEISLTSFEFWGGAKERAKMLTYEEIEEIGILEDIYDEIEDATINKLFQLSFSQVCESIGIKYNKEEDRIIREEESE